MSKYLQKILYLFRNLSNWDKFFYIISTIILFIPPITYYLFTKGVSIIYHQINIFFIIVFVIVSNLYLVVNRKDNLFYIIPFTSVIVFFFSFISSFNEIYSYNNFSKLIAIFISLTVSPFLSIFLIKYYRKKGNIELFLTYIFYTGLLISFVNIYIFILLYFGNYTNIFNYTDFIGLGSYIKDLGSFFVRPAGYFFDLHSQYYMPIISFFILYTKNIKLTKKTRLLFFSIILLSILISGVKSAYISLFVCIFYLIIRKINLLIFIKYFLVLFLLINISNFFLEDFFYKLAIKIITHDINIIIEHLTEVPTLLYNKYFSVFLFGGQVDLHLYIYSEVYYVTIIYYIGLFGLIIFFLFPIIFLIFKSTDTLTKLVTIIFGLSLMHYYVFKISFNVIGTTLFYFYFFKNLFIKENA